MYFIVWNQIDYSQYNNDDLIYVITDQYYFI